jgi:uncharacterized RDD family membrane protein YckC
MSWYYAEAGQQAGPIDDAQWEQLIQSGRIQPETLVWREGMANWQPYNQVRSAVHGASSPAGTPTPTALATAAPSEAVCAECGGVFNIQDTIAYGNARVCARCKPVFIQKLAEGAKLNTGQMVYARFFTRFAAVLLDWVILFVINLAVSAAGGIFLASALRTPSAGLRTPSAAFIVFQIVLMLINLTIAVSYETVLIGKYGATVGKMALKIKVVTAEGAQVSYLLAFGRYFAKILSGMILLIGYLMAAFDDEKRALHDRICNTRVIVSK